MTHAPSASLIWMTALETATEFLRAWRMPSFTLPSILFPLGFYTLFGLVIPQAPNAGAYLMATFGILAALGPALFGFGVGVATESKSGWLEMKRLSPMPVAAFLIAKLLMCMLFTLVVLAGLYSLGAYVGAVRLHTSQWALLALAHLVSAIPMGLLGLALGLMLPPQGAAGVINVVFLVMAALGGLFIPIALLPGPMQAFANALPTFHMAEICLAIIGVKQGPMHIHLIAMAGFTAVFAALAGRAWFQASAR